MPFSSAGRARMSGAALSHPLRTAAAQTGHVSWIRDSACLRGSPCGLTSKRLQIVQDTGSSGCPSCILGHRRGRLRCRAHEGQHSAEGASGTERRSSLKVIFAPSQMKQESWAD